MYTLLVCLCVLNLNIIDINSSRHHRVETINAKVSPINLDKRNGRRKSAQKDTRRIHRLVVKCNLEENKKAKTKKKKTKQAIQQLPNNKNYVHGNAWL